MNDKVHVIYMVVPETIMVALDVLLILVLLYFIYEAYKLRKQRKEVYAAVKELEDKMKNGVVFFKHKDEKNEESW